jgi:hypothetical protein
MPSWPKGTARKRSTFLPATQSYFSKRVRQITRTRLSHRYFAAGSLRGRDKGKRQCDGQLAHYRSLNDGINFKSAKAARFSVHYNPRRRRCRAPRLTRIEPRSTYFVDLRVAKRVGANQIDEAKQHVAALFEHQRDSPWRMLCKHSQSTRKPIGIR